MSKMTKKSGRKSDEERQMLLQQRGQAEEELKEKEEEMLGLFLKDKLQEEQRNTAVTVQKINDGWREMLRLAQEPELRHEIIMCQQMFEKEMDDLESIIKQMLLQSQQLEVLLQNLKLTAEQQNEDALDEIKAFYEQTQMNYLKTLEEQMAAEEFSEEVKEAIQRNIEGLQHSNKLSADTEDLFTESQEKMIPCPVRQLQGL